MTRRYYIRKLNGMWCVSSYDTTKVKRPVHPKGLFAMRHTLEAALIIAHRHARNYVRRDTR